MNDNNGALQSDFFHRGFVVLGNAVSASDVEGAIREINHGLGHGKYMGDTAFTSSPTICATFNKSDAIHNAVSKLLGGNGKRFFFQHCQIALRFPGTLCIPGTYAPAPWWKNAWHIDGIDDPKKREANHYIRNFTLLVGVALCDSTAKPNCGNLVVYPGGHHLTEEYFQKFGFDEAKKQGLKSLHVGLPPAEQVLMRAGDVVLAHYMLPHSIAPNTSSAIRYQLYFRINVRVDGQHHEEPMLNIWLDFPGVPRLQRQRLPTEALSVMGAAYVSTEQAGSSAALEEDAQNLFEAHRWADAIPLLSKLYEQQGGADILVALRLGIALTAAAGNDGAMVLRGATVLKTLADAYPMFAQGRVWYARNVVRQHQLNPQQPALRENAIQNALFALQEAAEAPDIVIEALKVLQDVQFERQQDAFAAARTRYPQLQIPPELAGVNATAGLWVQGHLWMQREPKDLQEGLRIFSSITALDGKDYWAHVLHGGCLLWSGKPGEALVLATRARSIDPLYPHAYTIGAQCLAQLPGRRAEAVALVQAMLETPQPLKLNEPDHFDKVVEALQLVANILGECQRLSEIKFTAASLFPSIADRINSITKREDGCSLQ